MRYAIAVTWLHPDLLPRGLLPVRMNHGLGNFRSGGARVGHMFSFLWVLLSRLHAP